MQWVREAVCGISCRRLQRMRRNGKERLSCLRRDRHCSSIVTIKLIRYRPAPTHGPNGGLAANSRTQAQLEALYQTVAFHARNAQSTHVAFLVGFFVDERRDGRGAHQLATKLAEAQRRCADLEDRLTRSERSRQAALAERDALRSSLTEHEMN